MERVVPVGDALAKIRAPLFLAREQTSRHGRRIFLHTTEGSSAASLRKQAESALSDAKIVARCRVVVHTSAALAHKQSLEAFNAMFGAGETVFDPTGTIGRTAALTRGAASLRSVLGDRLEGIFIDAGRRALFVILDRSRFSIKPETMLEQRVEAMDEIAGTIKAWRVSEPNGIDVAVRVGFELPANVVLIPVDRYSERFTRDDRTFLTRLRKPGIAATLASLVGLGGAAQAMAADLPPNENNPIPVKSVSEPAVAAPNIGLIGAGGWVNGDGFSSTGWGAGGLEATVPLSDHFGAQLDAAVGTSSYYGVGGHLFWRDPSRGMVGVLGSYESMSTGTLSRVAVEGEVYKDALTLSGEVGAQSGTVTGAFGSLDLTFYATPNFLVKFGGEVGGRSLGRASVEWQPAVSGLPGLSLFADGEVGSNGYSKVLAGVKYYFGTNGATLKDRDRRYDPPFSLFNTQNLSTKSTPAAGYAI